MTSQTADLLLSEILHKSRAEEVKGGLSPQAGDTKIGSLELKTSTLCFRFTCVYFWRSYCERLCRKRMEGTEMTTMSPKPTSPSGGQTTLETVDIVVLVIYFLLILAVGFWVSLSSLATRLFSCQYLWLKKCKQCECFSEPTLFWCGALPTSGTVA